MTQQAQSGRALTSVPIGHGLPSADECWDEIRVYVDVMLGRTPPPIQSPYLTTMEVATAYYARLKELEALIHRGERLGIIKRGSEYQRFRTGELESAISIARKMADLGSRRLTQEQILYDARRTRSQ